MHTPRSTHLSSTRSGPTHSGPTHSGPTHSGQRAIPESQVGPAEQLLGLVLNSSAHLWHNRPGIDVGGVWQAATRRAQARLGGRRDARFARPGLFVPAAVRLYSSLLEIYRLNPVLLAHFASYALAETEWRDLKIACAALLLVQPRKGEPVHEESGEVAFYDDDYRATGEALLLFYEQGSKAMLNPKGVLRVAQLLEAPEIAELNRAAGFASEASAKAPLGRWKSAARQWLRFRERNLPLLEGLVKAGFKETIKRIARKAGYRPESARFFALLGWKQKQAAGGHRRLGLSGLALAKRERFDGLSEAQICARISAGRLSYKDVVGRLPAETGLTAAILVALLPSLSDRDLRIMTPSLESFGLLADAEVRARWERALESASDQRALNVAHKVSDQGLRAQLEGAAERAAQRAVEAAHADASLHVMFLVDVSGSMEAAIERSKEALSRILSGFDPTRLHVASFNSLGQVLVPKARSRRAVQHMLAGLRAAGGTVHGAGVRALARAGVGVPAGAELLVIVAGDEMGEGGAELAASFREAGYAPSAFALINCASTGWARGATVREASVELGVPFSEVEVASFEDPYQVPRVLRALLEAPRIAGVSAATSWVERVLAIPLLQK